MNKQKTTTIRRGNTELLKDFFGITVKAVKKAKLRRKHRVIRELESNGFSVEKSGKEWNVWVKGDGSTIAIYDRLWDIPLTNPV